MFKTVLLAALFLDFVMPGHSQLLSLGVKGGLPLTDALHGFSSDGTRVSTSTGRWLVGPTLELHLPFRLSIEVDALFRRESYAVTSTSAAGTAVALQWFTVDPAAVTTTASLGHSLNDLQLPFLAKYELHGGLVRPFIAGGITYRYLFGGGPINESSSAGISIGGGLALKLLLLRLSPEIRYTHWGNNNVYAPYVTHSANQADFMVGLTF